MLLRFRFSNFRSFREEQELSLVASNLSGGEDRLRERQGFSERILPVAAIYGANASGKTNVLRALNFLSDAVTQSHQQWKPDGKIPRESFLGEHLVASEFEVDFLIGSVRHQYGVKVDSESVLEEWLHVYPRGKKQKWFHRTVGHPMAFSTKMPGENRVIETLTRPNSLFLSAAAQNNHEALLPVYRWITGLLFVLGPLRGRYIQHAVNLCATGDYLSEIAKLLSGADLGVSGLEITESEPTPEQAKLQRAVAHYIVESAGMDPATIGPLPKTREFRLVHQIGTQIVRFGISEESEGTVAYLSMLGPVIDALKKGVPLIIDELDGSLHPLLSASLIRLFNDTRSNPNGAQLIFNTHDTNLLSNDLLRRDQIWFTEKGPEGASHLFPLSDIKPRANENLQNGYLQGKYGAIPFLNPGAFAAGLEESNGKKQPG